MKITISGAEMILRPTTSDDQDDLLNLHREVFGSHADPAWYAWKYGPAPAGGAARGVGLWHDARMIAHCGGTPRRFTAAGEACAALQIGDVMVARDWRGILTRRGPFYAVSSAFYADQIGVGRAFQLGFGFPNLRHAQLAVTQRLSVDGGAVHSLLWTTQDSHAACPEDTLLHEVDPETFGFDYRVRILWRRMRDALPDAVVGDRNPEYLRWRFAQRPGKRYRFFFLRKPWQLMPAGLLVFDLGQDGVARWLDWIGLPADMQQALRSARRTMQERGYEHLEIWVSEAARQGLDPQASHTETEVARIGVVVHSRWLPTDANAPRWWLLGGDTDFL